MAKSLKKKKKILPFLNPNRAAFWLFPFRPFSNICDSSGNGGQGSQ